MPKSDVLPPGEGGVELHTWLHHRADAAHARRRLEYEGDFTSRLAMLEELKSLPAGAVWDYHCLTRDVPVGGAWLAEIRRYEEDVLMKR